MISKEQYADFGMDALFTAYGDGIITKTSVAWNGYIREVPINTKDFPAADVLVRKAENSLVGIGWGYRFVAVLAGCPYES